MKEKLNLLLSSDAIQSRVSEIAVEINDYYKSEPLTLICVLKGSIYFMCDLSRHLDMPVNLDFMVVSSYNSATESSGRVQIRKDLDQSIEGKNVLIVEDIIDSGNTLSTLVQVLKLRNPKSIRLCTVLDKPERRVAKDVRVDFSCFQIPDEFVVGYGMDFDQRYRNLPYIASVQFIDD